MDEVMFRSDTVLSDVHIYTPNQRHLMVRLNGMGQPGKVLVHAQNPCIRLYFLLSHTCFQREKIGKTGLLTYSPHTS